MLEYDDMALPLFLRVFLLSSALSLLSYALLPAVELGTLAKLLALSLAMSMLIPVAYPHIRGVRKGDMVQAINAPQRSFLSIPFFQLPGQYVSLDSGRVGSHIRVMMPDGSWREAVVVSYPGFLTPARVRLLEAETSIRLL